MVLHHTKVSMLLILLIPVLSLHLLPPGPPEASQGRRPLPNPPGSAPDPLPSKYIVLHQPYQDYHYFPYKNHSMLAVFIHLDDTEPENGG